MARQKNTLIYSRKAYNLDANWARDVEATQHTANNLEDHIEKLEELYPDYTVEVLYTYEHSGMALERSPSCKYDSSLDGMVAYKKEDQLIERIREINDELC